MSDHTNGDEKQLKLFAEKVLAYFRDRPADKIPTADEIRMMWTLSKRQREATRPYVSVHPSELPSFVRHQLDLMGIGIGTTLRFRKRRDITDDEIRNRYHALVVDEQKPRTAAYRQIAIDCELDYDHVRRRIRQLGLNREEV